MQKISRSTDPTVLKKYRFLMSKKNEISDWGKNISPLPHP